MKKLILSILSILVFVGSSANVLAQGTIVAENDNGGGGPTAESHGLFFSNTNGTYYQGASINMTLLGGPTPTNLSHIVTLSGGTPLLGYSGLVFDSTYRSYSVPGVCLCCPAWLQVQAWIGPAASYAAAGSSNQFWAWNGSAYVPGDTFTFQNPTGGCGLPPSVPRSLDGMPAMVLRSLCSEYPVILQQPTNQAAYQGATAAFSVGTAFGGSSSFQWFFNSQLIPGANRSTLVLTNVQPTNGGYYFVVVFGQGCGDTISSFATLTVLINTLGLTLGAHPTLTINGVVGKLIGIQYTTNVSLPNSWSYLDVFNLTAPVQEWVDNSVDSPPGGVPRRFYRVVLSP